MFYQTFGLIYILKSSDLLHFCRSGSTVFGKSDLEGNILHILTRNVIFFYDYSNWGELFPPSCLCGILALRSHDFWEMTLTAKHVLGLFTWKTWKCWMRVHLSWNNHRRKICNETSYPHDSALTKCFVVKITAERCDVFLVGVPQIFDSVKFVAQWSDLVPPSCICGILALRSHDFWEMTLNRKTRVRFHMKNLNMLNESSPQLE
jgi:hypothetical protein